MTNPYAAAVLADRPFSYYPLDDASGASARDASGHGRNAVGAATITAGAVGPTVVDPLAFAFSSTHVDPLIASDGSPMGRGATGDTFEAWFYWTGTHPTYGVIAQDYDQYRGPWIGAGKLKFGGDVDPNITPTTNTWHHAVAATAFPHMAIYYDGAYVGTFDTAHADATDAAARQLLIGSDTYDDNCFDGRIAHVATYDYALTADRVAAHYAAAQLPIPPVIGTDEVAALRAERDRFMLSTATNRRTNASFACRVAAYTIRNAAGPEPPLLIPQVGWKLTMPASTEVIQGDEIAVKNVGTFSIVSVETPDSIVTAVIAYATRISGQHSKLR
jgi:hypothetical protein